MCFSYNGFVVSWDEILFLGLFIVVFGDLFCCLVNIVESVVVMGNWVVVIGGDYVMVVGMWCGIGCVFD